MTKYWTILIKIMVGVVISSLFTISLVMFTPSIFNKALNLWIELLPSFKYVHSEIQTKTNLAKQFGLDPHQPDAVLFKQLESTFPQSKDKSSPFFRFLAVHAYPDPCKFTLIGIHRTIDVSWRIEGLRCKGKEACELARTQQICPDQKRQD